MSNVPSFAVASVQFKTFPLPPYDLFSNLYGDKQAVGNFDSAQVGQRTPNLDKRINWLQITTLELDY